MGYKTLVSLNIAVIGEGKKAILLARKLVVAGHTAVIGQKDAGANDKKEFAAHIGDAIHFDTIENAAAEADVVIIGSPAADVREVAYLLDDVRRKVILDATFASDYPAGETVINTVSAISSITGSQHVVKCFDARTYKAIIDPLFKGEHIDLFVVGNSKKGKELTKLLAKDMGFDHCYDFGDATTIPLLEEMASCWQDLASRQIVSRKVTRKVPVKR